MGVSEKVGVPYFGGPYNKDPTIWGTILGSPIFGNSHILHGHMKPQGEPPALNPDIVKIPEPSDSSASWTSWGLSPP